MWCDQVWRGSNPVKSCKGTWLRGTWRTCAASGHLPAPPCKAVCSTLAKLSRDPAHPCLHNLRTPDPHAHTERAQPTQAARLTGKNLEQCKDQSHDTQPLKIQHAPPTHPTHTPHHSPHHSPQQHGAREADLQKDEHQHHEHGDVEQPVHHLVQGQVLLVEGHQEGLGAKGHAQEGLKKGVGVGL